ncbi:uncharacterized protein PV07_10665 [Cladophialophora immunda]|uniref:BD-FAE-like domain-containing protein n=1 Tax=Cladophialophora immunda TaxID=569365 RepID=A0A0D2CN95_9EURO|nr:uncharacterized protein PV07_10665 [Cladophialophora immunda]KIW24989.1 hypothetical protein PV07_10665 [Cladophialophora immunda]OQV06656.1 hypothetical protein CLAIMM_11198 [Cladophialophora immunda]
MDTLTSLGTSLVDILHPTYRIYAPLLMKNADAIRSTARRTYAYGTHPRQILDFYSPSSENSRRLNKHSVLIFLYGGGLARGNRVDPDFAEGLLYANVGYFFSEQLGIQVVIPDYRLLAHGATFPSGGEDLALVVEWVSDHLSDNHRSLDIFLMGHSAGGLHLATYLMASELGSRRNILTGEDLGGANMKAVIFLSVPLTFDDARGTRRENFEAYYGKDLARHSPLALFLDGLKDESLKYLADASVAILTCSLDPEVEILAPTAAFVKAWQHSALFTQLAVVKVDGHNHFSPVLSLGTGIPSEELWGQQLVDFMIVASEKESTGRRPA